MTLIWPPAAPVQTSLRALDLTDGTWSVYDPASRIVASATRITGTHKNKLDLTFGSLANTIATGVTYYRKIRDGNGVYPSNLRRLAHRTSVGWASRLVLTTAHRMVLMAGYANGPPTTGASIVRLYGLEDGAGNSQIASRIVGTAAASTYTAGGTNIPQGRAVHHMLQRLSTGGAMQVTPAIPTDGHGDTTNTLVNTYTYTANEQIGIETDVYEYIFIGCSAANGALQVYIAGESGLVGPNDGGCHYSPEFGGAEEPLYVWADSDSKWFGGAAGSGIGAGYAGVQRAFQEFAIRRTGRPKRRPVRFAGYAGNGQGHGLDGMGTSGAASGRSLVNAVADTAARMAALNSTAQDLKARGGRPDIFLLILGTQDASVGRTAAQMRADIVTIAALVKTEFPNCQVVFLAAIGTGYPEYITLREGILAALPANVDGYLDIASWWTDAFVVSGADGHSTLVASPTALAGWDGPFSMNAAGANYSQHGVCAYAYALFKYIYGIAPPLLSGEVAPF